MGKLTEGDPLIFTGLQLSKGKDGIFLLSKSPYIASLPENVDSGICVSREAAKSGWHTQEISKRNGPFDFGTSGPAGRWFPHYADGNWNTNGM